VSGIFHKLRRPPIDQANQYLFDFLQERWKGLLPILWGQQLRQERLDELIYLSVLNTDHLPGKKSSPISPILYKESTNSSDVEKALAQTRSETRAANQNSAIGKTRDVLVIGAGLAGLSTAWSAATAGKSTSLISKGQGALYWHTGCIDILAYNDDNNDELIREPLQALKTLIKKQPRHPYAIIGLNKINEAINQFKEMCSEEDYPLQGSLESNWILPSSLGAKRATSLAPDTMIAGNMNMSDPMWIIGFEGYYDFYPEMIADNIINQGIPAKGICIDIKSLSNITNINTILLASKFESIDFRQEVVLAIKKALGRESKIFPKRIGFPAILGNKNAWQICKELRDNLGIPVFEIPTLPPSIAGIRLSNLISRRIEKLGGSINIGLEAIGYDLEQGRSENGNNIKTIWSEAAARRKPHRAKKIVLATGGILGGGLYANYNGEIVENVLNLPISSAGSHNKWFQRHFISKESHPIFQTGIKVNNNLQPIDETGEIILNNLYVAGTTIEGFDYLRERSFDGVALVSGYSLGKNI
jgi:glycerol-3-phosphate dehydrogenase subunit B